MPKARRLAGLSCPTTPSEPPDKPGWLSAEASDEWDRITADLVAAGGLARVDRAALAAYCQAWSDVVALTATVEGEGRTFREPIQNAGGEVIGERVKPHPAVRQLESASARMRQYLIEFGLSPAARARMGADTAKASAGEKPANRLGEIASRVQAARNKKPPKPRKPKAGEGKAGGEAADAGE